MLRLGAGRSILLPAFAPVPSRVAPVPWRSRRGHVSVGMDDLTDCIDRVHATVSACLKRVGMEADATTDTSSLSPPAQKTSSVLGRLGSRLSSTRSSDRQTSVGKSGDGDGGAGARAGGGLLEVTFGESGDRGGGGSSGLYLSSD
eukprot:COSAG06_NODE_28217_length_578_cov_1.164927_1_plen_145_part_00